MSNAHARRNAELVKLAEAEQDVGERVLVPTHGPEGATKRTGEIVDARSRDDLAEVVVDLDGGGEARVSPDRYRPVDEIPLDR